MASPLSVTWLFEKIITKTPKSNQKYLRAPHPFIFTVQIKNAFFLRKE